MLGISSEAGGLLIADVVNLDTVLHHRYSNDVGHWPFFRSLLFAICIGCTPSLGCDIFHPKYHLQG
jgi:hypothetical protein